MREFPKEAIDLELVLEARIRKIVVQQLNEALSRAQGKMRYEAKLCLRPFDQRVFERASEMVDMIIDEVNNGGIE